MAKARAPKKPKTPRSPKKGPEDFPISQAHCIKHALEQIRLTEHQMECVKLIEENKISFVQGPAGTAKTFVMCYAALKMLANNTIRKIILSKPAAAVQGQELGFVPGTLAEKTEVMMESYIGNLQKILGDKLLTQFVADGLIEYKPLTFMRCITATKVFIVLDEAQNTDYKSLILFITRFGKGSKMMISGDVSQYDIQRKSVKLPDFIAMWMPLSRCEFRKLAESPTIRKPSP